MPSSKPLDFGGAKTGPRSVMSPVERAVLHLGQFTANNTVTPDARLLFDRKSVIREIWIEGSAIPSDADGTMLLNALVKDVSENADDTIVSSADLETLLVAAEKAYKATLASEGSEKERTVEAGDVLRFTLVSNSAAIDTNSKITVLVIYQALKEVTG